MPLVVIILIFLLVGFFFVYVVKEDPARHDALDKRHPLWQLGCSVCVALFFGVMAVKFYPGGDRIGFYFALAIAGMETLSIFYQVRDIRRARKTAASGALPPGQ
jgi:hypothetical protein